MAKILIIDDEERIASGVKKYYEQAGYSVIMAYDGLTGLKRLKQEKPDLVVLDLMLPEMDGWDVCKEIRKISDIPIIMLTARVEETDKLIGLELGADDYVTKPFSPRELVARTKAVLRRAQAVGSGTSRTYRFGNNLLDIGAHQLTVDGKVVDITPTEFSILHHLVSHPKQVSSRSQLLEAADLGVFEGVERSIDVHIHNLRTKIEKDPANPQFIQTVFGVGYRFVEGEE